nr:hypothetical protein [Tanacetum cinerariifolium]
MTEEKVGKQEVLDLEDRRREKRGKKEWQEPVRTALLTRVPLPDVKDAYAIVSREESHRGISETSENYTRGNGSNNYNIGPNPNLVCKNYGFTGHTIERCYELIGYPPGYKKGSNASKKNGIKPNFNANCDTKGCDKQPTACNSPISFTADQMQKLLNLINDTNSGNTQANMAGDLDMSWK